MEGPSTTVSKNHPRPGSIVFSTSREITENTQVYSRLFRCRKNKFDFIGQIKINLQEIAANVEVFNTNYFDCFDTPLKNVTLVLKNTLFTKLLSEKNLPERLREAISSLLNKNGA